MARYTISMDAQTYGDGVTREEIRRMAHADARALRSRWPDADIRVVEGPTMHTTDDHEIHEYALTTWDRILSTGCNGGPGPDAVVAAWELETVADAMDAAEGQGRR